MADPGPRKMNRERERKFAVHGPFEPPDVKGVDGVVELRALDSLSLRALYYDTEDLRLARFGSSLRYRSGEAGGPRWTLKLPAGEAGQSGLLDRLEVEFRGSPARVPAEARDLALAMTRGKALVPVSDLRTRRRRWSVVGPDDAATAELVQDEVSVMHGRRIVSRFRELELEDAGLGDAGIAAIGERLRSAGAVDAEPISKVVRALGPLATAPPDVIANGSLSGEATAGDAVKTALRAGAARLIAHHPGVLMGDIEAVHQMRVATRRLRADLRTFGPLALGPWAAELRDRLEPLADLQGAVRDTDVMAGAIADQAADLAGDLGPLVDSLRSRHDAAHARLRASLLDEAYVTLLERLVGAANQPSLRAGERRRSDDVLPALLDGVLETVIRRIDRIGKHPTGERLHQLRLATKRGRYATEAIGPSLSGDAGRRTAKLSGRLRELQEALGDHQDTVVMEAFLREVAREHAADGALCLAIGRMIERQHRRRRSARNLAMRRIGRTARAIRVRGGGHR